MLRLKHTSQQNLGQGRLRMQPYLHRSQGHSLAMAVLCLASLKDPLGFLLGLPGADKPLQMGFRLSPHSRFSVASHCFVCFTPALLQTVCGPPAGQPLPSPHTSAYAVPSPRATLSLGDDSPFCQVSSRDTTSRTPAQSLPLSFMPSVPRTELSQHLCFIDDCRAFIPRRLRV